ncbi:MAG TPA: hypothetical protein VM241_06300 [Candidatus Thermoplasmatota archaeon]|nr:hypothetical protein [Candidatus Thermoplasmatota archaeon]
MPARSVLPALAILALLLPALAPAEAAPSLVASSMVATGAVSTQAALGALSLHDPADDLGPAAAASLAAPALPSPDFRLQATRITAATYVADPAVHALTAVSAPPTTQWRNFTQAMVQGTEVRPGYRVFLFPLEGHAAPVWDESGTCAGATASSVASLPGSGRAGAPDHEANVEGAVAWAAGCDASAVRHVRGDFLLALWQWDARVESASGAQALPSGQEPLAPAPGAAPAPGYPSATLSRDRQVFLAVTGGDLLLPALQAPQAFLFEPRVHAIGRVVLRGASGFLAAQGQEVQADEVSLAGDLTVTMAHGGDRAGIPMQVDGVLAGSPGAVLPKAGLPAWLWLAAIPLLGVVPLVAWQRSLRPRRATPAAQRRALELYGHAETFAFEGEFGKARRLLDRAISLEGLRPDLFALRARCRAALGDTEAALRDHVQAHEGFPATDPDARASNAYEAARTCGRAGRRDEALSWLRLAAQYDPHCMDDATDDPILLALFTQAPGRQRPAAR